MGRLYRSFTFYRHGPAGVIDNLDSVHRQTVRQNQPIEIFPQAFGSSSIDIEVTWWTDPEQLDIRRSRGEVVTAIKFALDQAGIEIPFPYRTLTFKEPLTTHVVAEQDRGSIS